MASLSSYNWRSSNQRSLYSAVVTTSSQIFWIMVKQKRKRNDLAMEDFQKARDEWNKERLKRLDFINKRLRDQQHAKQAITNLEEGMREYYQVFGSKV